MRIEDYLRSINDIIGNAKAVQSSQMIFEKRTRHVGFVKGELRMIDGSELHFREFVDVESGVERYLYAYHFQRDVTVIFRYDNTEHHRNLALPTFPHHKHDGSEDKVVSSPAPTLSDVLAEVEQLIQPSW